MSIFKKLVFVNGLILLTMSLSACKSSKDVRMELVFPADPSIVFVVDASNDDQLENAKKLMDSFPNTGVWALFKMGMIQGMISSGVSYEEEVKPLFEGDWRMGFSMNFPEELINLKSLDDFSALEANIGPEKFNLFLAFETEVPKLVENLLQKQVDEGNLEMTDEDDAQYWVDVAGDGIIVRYDDLFFITVTKEMADKAVERLENGEGFKTEKIAENNLGYMYLDMEPIKPLVQLMYSEIGATAVSEDVEILGKNWFYLAAEETGFRLGVDSEIVGGAAALKKIGMDLTKEIGLLDKVAADGVFLYAEDYSLSSALKPMKDYYSEFLDTLAGLASTDADTLDDILNSPFAIVASNVDAALPGLTVYLKLDETKVEEAKDIVLAMDSYVDAVLVEFDKVLELQELSTGVVKRETAMVAGAALHKLSLDFSAYPDGSFDLVNNYAGFDITAVPLDLYYGITGDDVFVIALYPEFEKVYGKNSLADDVKFKEAMKMIGGNAQQISYFNPSIAASSIIHFLKIAAAEDPANAEMLEQYEKNAKVYVETLKYIVGGSSFKDGHIVGDVFVKIEKPKAKATK